MAHKPNNSSKFSESGTVTAALAVAMPTGAKVIAVTVSQFGLRLERIEYVASAASSARAIDRYARHCGGPGTVFAQDGSLMIRVTRDTSSGTALSADDALRGLITGYPCEIANEIATENMVILVECRIVGFEAFVKLHVESMGIVLNATARAGPSS